MKSYKLVKTERVLEKLERLSITTRFGRDLDFILINNGEFITSSHYDYVNAPYEEITEKDFLLLPEPLKVGDWVKVGEGDKTHITKIEKIDSGTVLFYKASWSDSFFMITARLDQCTKLTKEQIKILELEK